jgi:hypothetical protein
MDPVSQRVGPPTNPGRFRSLARVTFEDGLYVHASHGTFFTEEGVDKQFTLAQGREWTGGDSIDDYA